MTRRNPPAKWVLPAVIDPPRRRCYQIYVPDEPQHVAAFWGALLDLASAYKWADDPTHKARLVALVWREIVENLQQCQSSPPSISIGADTGVEFMIRQNPDNPCILESSLDGITWCQWADLSKCFSNVSQPGTGAEQPRLPNTPCVDYNGQLLGSGLWVLPTNVSTDDTLQIIASTGATNDGGGGNWWCPDGSQFFAGQCVGGTGSTSGSDPLPSAKHMSIVCNINGTWYPIADGALITVPGGVANVQPYFQMNDSGLTNNSGSVSFTVRVCRNAPSTWTSTLDFTLSSYSSIVTILSGTYIPGMGYQNVGAPSNNPVQININTDPFVLTGFDQEYNQSGSIGGTGEGVGMWASGAYFGGYSASSIGTGLHKTASGSQSGVTILQPTLNPGLSGSATSTLVRQTIFGSGPKPSQLP